MGPCPMWGPVLTPLPGLGVVMHVAALCLVFIVPVSLYSINPRSSNQLVAFTIAITVRSSYIPLRPFMFRSFRIMRASSFKLFPPPLPPFRMVSAPSLPSLPG